MIIDLKYSSVKWLTKYFKVLHRYILSGQWRPFLINHQYWSHLKVNISPFTPTIKWKCCDARTLYVQIPQWNNIIFYACTIVARILCNYLNCDSSTDCKENPNRLLCHMKKETANNTETQHEQHHIHAQTTITSYAV